MEWSERVDRLDAFIAEGRLIRDEWVRRDADGRELACLYAALVPEHPNEPWRCPAEVMQPWLAELTPWINDAGSAAHWPDVVRRYARDARRWHLYDAHAWQRAEWRAKRAALVLAREHAVGALAVVDRVTELLDHAIAGDVPSSEEWGEAAAEAAAATSGAAGTAWWAATAARSAAREAARSAMEVAAVLAASAAWAEDAEARAAADRIIDCVFDGIEAELQTYA